MITTSVLINNYNNGAYLKACVESALDQTQPADEVIVYDDGSTDESLAILRTFLPRIILIEGARTNLPSRTAQARASYEAFRRSHGKLVFLLDGDDRFHREKIEIYARAFGTEPNAVLVQAPLREIDGTGRPLGTNHNPMKHKDDYLAATYQLHDVDFYYPTSALAFSRRFLEATLPLDYSDGIQLSIDTRLGMLAPLYGKIISLETDYSDWRRHSHSHSIQPGRYSVQLFPTLQRTRVFNRFCQKHNLRKISLWRNRRFYLQLLRLLTPKLFYSLYYHWTRLSPASIRQTEYRRAK